MANWNIFTGFDGDADTPSRKEEDLRASYEQAVNRDNALYLRAAATAPAAITNPVASTLNYSEHEAKGIGTYVIPRRTGWNALLDVIHDPVPNIDFSANIYPNFDGIIGEHFESPYLLDPLDGKYESYESLRDNLAAVRNLLLVNYYADDKMAPAAAKEKMAEIAAFVGDGLYNNYKFGGLISNHDPRLPHIDLEKARGKNGKGAQYIYECILAHDRTSSWKRPFNKVIEMMGGKAASDWKLPGANETHFTDWFSHDITPKQISGNPSLAETNAAIMAGAAGGAAYEAQMEAARNNQALSLAAQDLSKMGDMFIHTVQNIGKHVSQMSEPARRTAVEEAKNILKNLKVSLGGIQVLDGLKLKPSDDRAVLGSVTTIAEIYSSLLAWAKKSDTSILQHPAVVAATQAIGQLGYVAKVEALNLADRTGNSELVANLRGQIAALPEAFKPRPGTTFGNLLDTIQNGMETILSRTQEVEVNGGHVGHSLDGQQGSGLFLDPTAGAGNQTGAESAIKRNETAMAADQLALEMQTAQTNSQLVAQARKQNQSGQATAPAPGVPTRSASAARNLNAIKANVQRQKTANSTVRTTAPINLTQLQANRAATSNNMAAAARRAAQGHHDEEEHHLEQERIRRQQILNQQKAKATFGKIDAGTLKGIKNATSMQGVTGPAVTGGRAIDPKSIKASMGKPATAPGTVDTSNALDNDRNKTIYPVPPRGNGRGF